MLAERARTLNSKVHETAPIAQIDPAMPHRSPGGPKVAGTGFRVLFIGRVLRGKGLNTLLESIALIARCGQQLLPSLDVIGDGPDYEFIKQLAAGLGILAHCHFHGYLSDPARFAVIWESADVLVMPSTSPEGVPRVIEEAFAWDVPVISTDVGGIAAEFQKGEVLLVPPSDPEALAAAILRVQADSELRNALRAHGRNRMAKWAALGSAGNQHARLLAGAEGSR
jgi:glycosyltransferase involved in cell wall biosynthesis